MDEDETFLGWISSYIAFHIGGTMVNNICTGKSKDGDWLWIWSTIKMSKYDEDALDTHYFTIPGIGSKRSFTMVLCEDEIVDVSKPLYCNDQSRTIVMHLY